MIGTWWIHKKTDGKYVVKDIALREDDLVPVVVYAKDGSSGPRWTRPIEQFLDGRFEPAGLMSAIDRRSAQITELVKQRDELERQLHEEKKSWEAVCRAQLDAITRLTERLAKHEPVDVADTTPKVPILPKDQWGSDDKLGPRDPRTKHG